MKPAGKAHSKTSMRKQLAARYQVSVIKDFVEAHALWNVASALGNEDAKFNLSVAEKEMTPEQVAEATKLAKERFAKIKKQ